MASMEQGLNTVERAFQLAEQCANVDEITAKLKEEGFTNVDAHLAGGAIRADLTKILEKRGSS